MLTVLVLTSCCLATFAISYITKPVPDVSENTGFEDSSLPDASASAHDSDSMDSNHNQSDSGAWLSKDELGDAGSSGDVTIDDSRDQSETSAEMSEDGVSRHEETSKDQHGDPSVDSSDDEPTNLPQDESDPGCTSEPEYPVGRDDSPADIRKTYEAFLASRGAGRRILSLEPLIGLLPITGFYEEGDAYSIGGLAVINDGVISGEDGLFRYHTSQIPGAEAEDVGVYDSYDRLSELGFPDPYKIYCRTYVKEGITVYALSVHPEPYAYINMYQLYFNIDGTWFSLTSNGYTYPSVPGVLRGPDEWDQGFAYVTDATEELSDVGNASSALIRAIKSALAQ